jgi:DNA-damage-inducible protein J
MRHALRETPAGKTTDTYVRARIDSATKELATDALAAMGLSVSDAIRLLMVRVVDEQRLPFEIKAPNATTRAAIAELEAGSAKRFATIEALMADLNADD